MLVDGGAQKRSFTFIDDGVECILKILENKDGCADGKIFNIGNPDMEFSIRGLAEMLGRTPSGNIPNTPKPQRGRY